MSEYKRQTEQSHNINLPSKVVLCHWRKNIAATGEIVNYNILTEFISDNSPIKISISDDSGNEVFKVEKNIKDNSYTGSFEIPETESSTLTISIKIPDYGLQATSKPLKIVQSPVISELKWSEDKITLKLPKKKAESEPDNEEPEAKTKVTLSAKTKNIPNKSQAHITISTAEELTSENTVTTIPVKIEDDSITSEWEFDKETIRPYLPESENKYPCTEDKNTFATLYFFITYKSQQLTSPSLTIDQELTYIKFTVCDDIRDEKLKNIAFEIVLPDGTIHSAKTDSSGEIEVKHIEPGTCTIKTDIADKTIKNLYRYIGLGTQALQEAPKEDQDKNKKEQSNSSDNTDSTNEPITFAFIEEYKVETGDTLESIAESFNLSKDDITKFNWNTTDQEEINNCIYRYVGSSLLDSDNNLVFRSNDDPGIIFIPQKLELTDFKTNDFYTLRLSLIEERADLIIPVPMNLDGDDEVKDELKIISEDGSFEKIIHENDKENVSEDPENELLFFNFGELPDNKYKVQYKVNDDWLDLIAEINIKESDPFVGEAPFLAQPAELIKQEPDNEGLEEDPDIEEDFDEDELDDKELEEDPNGEESFNENDFYDEEFDSEGFDDEDFDDEDFDDEDFDDEDFDDEDFDDEDFDDEDFDDEEFDDAELEKELNIL